MRKTFQLVEDSTVSMVRIPLILPDAQVKITENWCVRPWLFESLFGDFQPYITALRVGNIVLLGTPCDYSGELTGPVDAIGKKHNLHPVITSFNGHYIGYITRDDHYDRNHYETRLMNWYGYGNGQYLADCLTRLTDAVAD
jgi:neutral ceramidase